MIGPNTATPLTELALADLDPWVGVDFGNVDELDPVGLDDEHIARLMRAARFAARDLARTETLFDRELGRITEAKTEATRPLTNRLESLEATLCGWLRWKQETERAAGVPEGRMSKSWKFPDGVIKSTAGRLSIEAAAELVDGSPWTTSAVKVGPDRAAVKAALESGALAATEGGALFDPETGETVPGITARTKSRTFKVTPAKDHQT